MHRFFFVFLLGALLMPSLLLAAERVALSPDAKAVESYLNGIASLRAHFVQTGNDGRRASGTFLLKRPGRMRFEYDPPVTDFIVADGLFVYYYDGKMKQQSNAPIGQSLANFFLRKELKLSGDIAVQKVERQEGLLELTLAQAKDLSAGSLTLFFTENPLRLKKWRVLDAQGLVTEVELSNVEWGVKIDNNPFHYYDPASKTNIYNHN